MDTIKMLIIAGILGLFVLAALTTRLPIASTSVPSAAKSAPTITVEPESEPTTVEPEPAPEMEVEVAPEPVPEPQTPPATG